MLLQRRGSMSCPSDEWPVQALTTLSKIKHLTSPVLAPQNHIRVTFSSFDDEGR